MGICRELDSVIGLFLVHRHLPEAAVQNKDPNLPLPPCRVLLPSYRDLSWKRDLGRGRYRNHTHTLTIGLQLVSPPQT